MTTYHFVAASERFLTEEEPLDEVLKERRRHYAEEGKEIDFWLVRRPAFLQAPEMAAVAQQVPQPSAAVVSTDPTFITFMKLRLEFVLEGQFEAPSNSISDALAEGLNGPLSEALADPTAGSNVMAFLIVAGLGLGMALIYVPLRIFLTATARSRRLRLLQRIRRLREELTQPVEG